MNAFEKTAALYDTALSAPTTDKVASVYEIYKEAGFGTGLMNAGKAIAGTVGAQVGHGATAAVGALGKHAPGFATKYAPQIAKGIGAITANPVATGAAALGAAGLGTAGVGAMAGRMTAPRRQ